jgi:ATP-binding cassette subfamily B protein
MEELKKLSTGFFKKNSELIITSIFLSALSSTIETVLVPRLLANIINNVSNKELLKIEFIKLVFIWLLVKVVYMTSTYYRRQLEPEITKYITNELLIMIFNKYEHENILTNVSVLINKIYLIKKCFQEFSYILFSVFIPRILVLLVGCVNVYLINSKIGLLLFACILFQIFTSVYDLKDCMVKSYDENETKDEMYEYIEDLFYNIDTIELTPNGFNFELKNINDMSDNIKKVEQESLDCITKKQYATNLIKFIFSVIILYFIYNLNMSNELSPKDTTTILLLIIGILDNMSEISYYIPEATSKFGLLMNNEDFLKSISFDVNDNKINKDLKIKLANGNIEFKNVSFSYENHKILDNFSLVIKENSFICLYGASGSGKSTFIKLIYGIEKPTSGQILLGGNDISEYQLKESRKYVSYINQNTTNLFNKTVYNNIIYGYNDTKELKDKIKKIFIDFDFYEIFKNLDEKKEKWSFLNENVGKLGENLSGGQKQLVHLLRLELNDTSKIVILDEPSSALDDKTRESVSKYIKYLNSKGKTILLITHDDYYKNICENILNFNNDTNPVLT